MKLELGRVERLEWVRAECDGGHCAEVTTEHGYVLVRNSTMPLEVIRFSPPEWDAFVARVKVGNYDLVEGSPTG